jgi:hypothetical protein
MDCLYRDNVETLQSKIPSFVWTKHVHRVPERLLKKKMRHCQYIATSVPLCNKLILLTTLMLSKLTEPTTYI